LTREIKLISVKKIGTTLVLFVFGIVLCFGQIKVNKRQREYSGFFDSYYYRGPITYTVGAGMSVYRGDLASTFSKNGLSYGLSLGANYKLWPHTVFGLQFSYVNLQSKDDNTARNISFTGKVYELQAYGRLYIIDEIVRIAKDRRKESQYTFCKPYITAGIAGIFYNATVQINSPSYLLAQYNPSLTQNRSVERIPYPRLGVAIPVGFGLQFNLDQRSSICAQYVYRYTFTDYLDGVSALGNSASKDGYGLLTVMFQYAPSAPKAKKKLALPPPAQYDGPKGTETWKTKKQQQQKQQPQEEYIIPENNTNTDDSNKSEEETTPTDEQQQPAQEETVPTK